MLDVEEGEATSRMKPVFAVIACPDSWSRCLTLLQLAALGNQLGWGDLG